MRVEVAERDHERKENTLEKFKRKRRCRINIRAGWRIILM
jgi:hypothetical protein